MRWSYDLMRWSLFLASELGSIILMATGSNTSVASGPSTERLHSFNPAKSRLYWTIRVFLALFTILGNTPLIFLLVTRRRLRRNLSNKFVLSLNLADLCVGLFVTPPELLCTYWTTCSREIQLAMYEFFVYTSLLSLCLVTWDRYKSVTRPLTYPVVIEVSQYLIPILLCWFVPLFVTLLHFTYLLKSPEEQGTGMKAFAITETLLFVGLPCIALPLAYLRIVCIIQRHKKQEKRLKDQVDFNYSVTMSAEDVLKETEFTAPNLTVVSARSRAQSELSSAGMESDVERSTDGKTAPLKAKPRHPNHDRSITVLGIVILVFVGCWLFAAYLHFKQSFSNTEAPTHSPHTTMNISWLFLLAHSAMNPFFYGLIKRDIKKEIKKCITCRG